MDKEDWGNPFIYLVLGLPQLNHLRVEHPGLGNVEFIGFQNEMIMTKVVDDKPMSIDVKGHEQCAYLVWQELERYPLRKQQKAQVELFLKAVKAYRNEW